MFKFNPGLASEFKRFGSNPQSYVVPYKEGNNDHKWAVKCVEIDNQEKIDNLLQNIILTLTSNSSGVVLIKGYDVQKQDISGHCYVYLRMPMMKKSFRDVIDDYRNDKKMPIPTEKIVRYLYSLAKILNGLAEQQISHLNLKPTNILLDKDGALYLSDIQMIPISGKAMQGRQKVMPADDQDLLYAAPETLADNWVINENNTQKSDVWSLGMIMMEACLMEKLICLSSDMLIQDINEAIEQNIGMIKTKYGPNLAQILACMVDTDPSQRTTFDALCGALETSFSYRYFMEDSMSRSLTISSQRSQLLRNITHDNKSYESNPFLHSDCETINRSFDISMQGVNENEPVQDSFFQKGRRFIQNRIFKPAGYSNLNSAESGLIEKNSYRNKYLGSNASLYDKTNKKMPIFLKCLICIVVVIISIFIALHYKAIAIQEKFEQTMKSLQNTDLGDYELDFENAGVITLVLKNDDDDTYSYKELEPERTLNKITQELISKGVTDLIGDIRLETHSGHQRGYIKDRSFERLAIIYGNYKNLKRIAIDFSSIITNEGLENFANLLTKNQIDLVSLRMGIDEIGSYLTRLDGFVSTILQKFKLEMLDLHFPRTKISDEELMKVAFAVKQYGKNLRTLRIEFSNDPKRSKEAEEKFKQEIPSSITIIP